MNKEEAIVEFLRGLRIVFNNASAYPVSHPYFIKSVESFKQKVDELLGFLSPIRINIAPHVLNIDGNNYDKVDLYIELADLFHFRKIQSIQINRGVAIGELIDFLSKVSLPIREILKAGGLRNLLNKENNPNIFIEELDYSQLLGVEGEELKDIWIFFFKEAKAKKDALRFNQLAENFHKIIGQLTIRDLFDDEEIRNSIDGLLAYLKNNDTDKFNSCIKDLFSFISRQKDAFSEEKIEKVKLYFKLLSEEDFADMLLDQVFTNENFDDFSFALFSRLAGKDRKEAITEFLSKKINDKQNTPLNEKAVKRVKNLLLNPRKDLISDVYGHILHLLFNNISFDNTLTFDRNSLNVNYRCLLVNLINFEEDRETLTLIIERFNREMEESGNLRDLDSSRYLSKVIRDKQKNNPALSDILLQAQKINNKFIEDLVWEDSPPEGAADLIDSLTQTGSTSSFYIEKIFGENRVNSYILKLFFRFFPQDLAVFYKKIEARSPDIEFMAKVIGSLGRIDALWAREALRNIFSISSYFIKIEILKAMQKFTKIDEVFLLPLLDSKEVIFRKGALSVLAKNPESEKKALESLLDIPNFWGIKNNIIMENISMIEELDLRSASENLESLRRRSFIFSQKLKRKISEILGKWNVK